MQDCHTRSVTVCFRVQCVAVGCSASEFVAACFNTLQYDAVCYTAFTQNHHAGIVKGRCTYTVCCSVLQYVAVCCSVLHSLHARLSRRKCHRLYWCSMCCSVVQGVAVCCSVLHSPHSRPSRRKCQRLFSCSMCCSVLQCVADHWDVHVDSAYARFNRVLCVAVCCSVLQCAAVCCSVLQCVAVCGRLITQKLS